MRPPFLALACLLCGLAAGAGAQVLRCTDAAGKVSYTNESACPPGTRQRGHVAEPPPAVPLSADEARRRQEQIDAASRMPAPTPPAPGNAAPGVIDARPPGGGDTSVVVIDGGSSGYPGRPARPPRDMRPRLRDCDNAGNCRDTQGNSYDRSGRLTQYQRPDGSVCRQVGTTQVCR